MATQFAKTFVNTFSSKLEPDVRKHLKNVYGSVCLATSVASLAAILDINYPGQMLGPGLGTQLAGILFLIALMTSRHTKSNMPYRFGCLAGLAYCVGTNLVPLLLLAIEVDPSVVVTALLGTALVFTSFSICSMLSEQGKWLYLGAPLMSFVNFSMTMLLGSFIFGGSLFVYNVNLYVGLVAMCGFVLYDTQMIIEKRRVGDDDFIAHSVDLFVDLVGIFRRLVLILTKREQDKKNRRK